MKEEYGYYTLLEIYTYPKFIPLKYYLDGIYHCVTVVSKWIFDSNFPFSLPLKKYNMEYCFINDKKTNVMNVYKGLLKVIMFSTKEKTKSVL